MKRERVISAVAHKNTEPAPHDVDLTAPLAQKVCDRLNIPQDGLWEWFGNHIEDAKYRKGEYTAPDIYRDPFGVVWDRTGADKDIGVIKEYIDRKSVV